RNVNASLSLEKHGALTQLLLDGLKGAADKDGYEPDGVVTVDELNTYLDKEFPGLARQHGKTKEEKEQRPYAWPYAVEGKTNHFALTKNPAVTDKVAKELNALEKLAGDGKVTKEVAEEGRKLLARMPSLKSQQALRRNYQSLVSG